MRRSTSWPLKSQRSLRSCVGRFTQPLNRIRSCLFFPSVRDSGYETFDSRSDSQSTNVFSVVRREHSAASPLTPSPAPCPRNYPSNDAAGPLLFFHVPFACASELPGGMYVQRSTETGNQATQEPPQSFLLHSADQRRYMKRLLRSFPPQPSALNGPGVTISSGVAVRPASGENGKMGTWDSRPLNAWPWSQGSGFKSCQGTYMMIFASYYGIEAETCRDAFALERRTAHNLEMHGDQRFHEAALA